MRTVLRDSAIRALASLIFLLTPLPPATLAAQAAGDLMARELSAVAPPGFEQAVLRDGRPSVHLLPGGRGERGQHRSVLLAALAAALAGLVLAAAPRLRPTVRHPRCRDRRGPAGPRAPPSPQLD